MDEALDKAIEIVTKRITPAMQADEALKFSQAALNLAHVKDVLNMARNRGKTKGASA